MFVFMFVFMFWSVFVRVCLFIFEGHYLVQVGPVGNQRKRPLNIPNFQNLKPSVPHLCLTTTAGKSAFHSARPSVARESPKEAFFAPLFVGSKVGASNPTRSVESS